MERDLTMPGAPSGAIGPLYDPAFEHDACGTGFVAQRSGAASHRVLELALEALCNHAHRGAVAADGRSGDGAGVLTQLPYALMVRELAKTGARAPEHGDLAVGMVFLPLRNLVHRSRCVDLLQQAAGEFGVDLLGWREVPVDLDALGDWAMSLRPYIAQVFIGRPPALAPGTSFERVLYLLRKRATQLAWAESITNFYIASLSSRTIVYKGLFMAPQLGKFYVDLSDPDYRTALAVFHQRYSTNTFPTWERAQPFRLLCHNGEINTLRGNIHWMRAREADLVRAARPHFGDAVSYLPPVIAERGSDSAMLDNALDLLVQAGRDIRHALLMLTPRAWEHDPELPAAQRAFYHYHACVQEPWDGPAALAFTDGAVVGSVLDRNGLRPARYSLLDDGLVIMSSEAGAVHVDEKRVLRRGRLGPGEMLAVDTSTGDVLTEREVVDWLAQQKPYERWLADNLIAIDNILPAAGAADHRSPTTVHPSPSTVPLSSLQAAFGYNREELVVLFRPMWQGGNEAVGSMGDDTPAAALSRLPRPLFHYFYQRFAEVTNPPIDPLREAQVMSLAQRLGRRSSMLARGPEVTRLLELSSPVLSNEHMAVLRDLGRHLPPGRSADFLLTTLDATWPVAEGPAGLAAALARLTEEAAQAVETGASLLVISDRGVDATRAVAPSLLALAAVHQRLISAGMRTHASLIVESGEARDVHHVATLVGYGANAVYPWLALETVAAEVGTAGRNKAAQRSAADAEGITPAQAIKSFCAALEKGLLKIMSKMGIATVDSYCGAQIFEALGLDQDVMDAYFPGTPARLGGKGLDQIAADALAWHRAAFATLAGSASAALLESQGLFKFKRGGEYHAYNPEVVRALHEVVGLGGGKEGKGENGRKGEEVRASAGAAVVAQGGVLSAAFQSYASLVEQRPPAQLRDLLSFAPRREPVPLDEVEPAEAILRRFSTAAMSHGALSGVTHETLAIAMNRLGGASNSGEGGEAEERYTDERNSKIKQVASGRFGVTPAYLMSAQELQIKMAQGSKPGEGGQLPGHKVSAEIARIRHTTPGVALISPPPHHDIYSIEDLAQLIFDLKQVNPEAYISVKLVSEAGVGTVAAGVAKGHADVIHLSGNNGGTGASPLSSIKHAGGPWELGLAETQHTLLTNGLRSRVRVRVDGGFQSGRDVVMAAMLGADEFSFGTAALIAVGCKMARSCHTNTCPVGVATQRVDLIEKFPGQPEHLMIFLHQVAEEVRQILAHLGYRSLNEVIGHTELLQQAVSGAAAGYMDLLPLLWAPDTGFPRRNVEERNQLLASSELGDRLADEALSELERSGTPVRLRYAIHNTDRTVGARLAGQLAKRYGNAGLPEGSIVVELEGTAGQSFGAFVCPGLHLRLTGHANDYLGKGLGGGEVVLRPPMTARYVWHENVILGNTALYGATGGALYAAGRAGERFAVRNSGAQAVVEGVGDHGCEYMTGGVVVVLGETGRNFGAGMTGGVAYVYDPMARLPGRYNAQLISLHRVTAPLYRQELYRLARAHFQATGSPRAKAILDDWEAELANFWLVLPKEAVAAIEAANEGAEKDEK
jgi:glutamate synthase (ferredoxin)